MDTRRALEDALHAYESEHKDEIAAHQKIIFDLRALLAESAEKFLSYDDKKGEITCTVCKASGWLHEWDFYLLTHVDGCLVARIETAINGQEDR